MQPPKEQDILYQGFGKNLYRLTGSEAEDDILNMLTPDNGANNSSSVTVSASDISSGVSSSTMQTATGSMQGGKKMFDNTIAGYILGVDPTDGFAKFYVGNSTNYLNWTGSSLVIKGNISASSLDIPDASTTHSFHVDSSGNLWIGATTFGAAPFSVSNTGALIATSATIAGYVTAPASYSTVGSTYLSQQGSTSNNTTTPTKVRELAFTATMPTASFVVTFTLFTGNPGVTTVFGQIYKNGVAYGTQQSTTSGAAVRWSEGLSFTGGDLCQLYLWSSTNLVGSSTNDFGILGLPVPSYFIPAQNL